MWWRDQPYIWAFEVDRVRVAGVRHLKSVETKRIELICTDRGLTIHGDGLLIQSWDRSLAEVRGAIHSLHWFAPGVNASE